jgi:hypothetical protein
MSSYKTAKCIEWWMCLNLRETMVGGVSYQELVL